MYMQSEYVVCTSMKKVYLFLSFHLWDAKVPNVLKQEMWNN